MEKKMATHTKNNNTNTQKINKQVTIDSFNKAEIKKLENKKDSFSKHIALFLYYTGLRINEALSLSVSDVSRTYVEIKGKGSKKKGKKIRTIKLSKKATAITKKLIERIKKYRELEPETPLFISQKAKRLSRMQAYRLVKEVTKDITEKPIRTSPHTLRHTFATVNLKNGVDVKHVSTQLGHSSTAITQDIYQHSTLDDLDFVDNM